MAAENNDNKAVVLDEVLTQFVNAYVQGERPDLDEFIEQYPQYEAQIRRRVGGLREIDALFDSLVQTGENDFVDTSAEHDLVGETIGSFEIVEMIGRGGMGVVYLARDTRLKRLVAIKSMPPQWKKDSAARTRFRREAELLASLNHPNIAVIHDIVEPDDRSGYLILEYVPGETLAERIKREPLTMDEVLSIGQQIAEAILAAHKKGIVHRDLKPGNIKITPDGQVKVLDFGLAKPFAREDESSEITETQPGRVIGTPAYMSPEQARGQKIDHRTDIWSFGCIMYQMLTGHLPFEGETSTDTLARIIEREPDWDLLPEKTPTNIRTLLRHCLEKDPDQRLGDIASAGIEISKTRSKSAVAVLRATVFTKSRRKTVVVVVMIITVLFATAVRFALTRSTSWSPRQVTEELRIDAIPEGAFQHKPVAHWTMDDVNGKTFYDSSGNGHHATARNGLPKRVDGPIGYGKALYFDGQEHAQGWLDCGRWNPSEQTGHLTVALWANWHGPKSHGICQALIGKQDRWHDNTQGLQCMWSIQLSLEDHHIKFMRHGSWPDCGGFVLPQGKWTHVTVTFDGTMMVFYVNGRETGRDHFSFGQKTDATIAIGCVESTGANGFHGALDDVRLYDRALSSQEVRALAKTEPEGRVVD